MYTTGPRGLWLVTQGVIGPNCEVWVTSGSSLSSKRGGEDVYVKLKSQPGSRDKMDSPKQEEWQGKSLSSSAPTSASRTPGPRGYATITPHASFGEIAANEHIWYQSSEQKSPSSQV
jgi:hypothetical protein